MQPLEGPAWAQRNEPGQQCINSRLQFSPTSPPLGLCQGCLKAPGWLRRLRTGWPARVDTRLSGPVVYRRAPPEPYIHVGTAPFQDLGVEQPCAVLMPGAKPSCTWTGRGKWANLEIVIDGQSLGWRILQSSSGGARRKYGDG
eukprot:2003403-Prymnesium_polylepis.1